MEKEFLLTNNLGGYTSSTARYGNMRKYHGLLVAGLLPDIKRNIVNRLEEILIINDKKYYLNTNFYKNGVMHPRGHRYLTSFKDEDYPVWHFKVKDIDIVKSLVIDKFFNTTYVKFEIYNPNKKNIKLQVIPLITNRDINDVKDLKRLGDFEVFTDIDKVVVNLDYESTLNITHPRFSFKKQHDTYFDFFYPKEKSRGESHIEDLKKIGVFEYSNSDIQSEVQLSFEYKNFNYNTLPKEVSDKPFLEYSMTKVAANKKDGLLSDLHNMCISRAGQFILSHDNIPSIVAGYHWFGEWGRDTFISFKGLLLVTKKYVVAEKLLYKWAKYMQNGLLPNRPFSLDYMSIDAMLWFTYAVWEYHQITKSEKIIRDLLPTIEQIYVAIVSKKNNLSVDEDGFLLDSDTKNARTWMDAKVQDTPVINRSGLAVDIQALWYNYLNILEQFKEKTGDQTHLADLKKTRTSIKLKFENKFWNKSINCLTDSILDNNKNSRITPNQLLILYLPFNDLVGFRVARRMLHTVETTLLTRAGLKSLNAKHADYHGLYKGAESNRAASYHQGTIWTYFLGIYLIAYLNIYKNSNESKKYVITKLIDFENLLKEHNLDAIPEIFEADTLKPAGCMSQAWSTGLMLEAISKVEN